MNHAVTEIWDGTQDQHRDTQCGALDKRKCGQDGAVSPSGFSPPWSLKRRCFWFAEMLLCTFRWAGDWRLLLFRSLLGRDLGHKLPLDNDSPSN